jgi:hypothetical protein
LSHKSTFDGKEKQKIFGKTIDKLKPSAIFAPRLQAKVAQLVERNLAKVKVAGSRPVFCSKIKLP